MSFEKIAEEKIEEAIAAGEFDNLPGQGKPLDLDAYFATPEQMRWLTQSSRARRFFLMRWSC